LDSAPTSAKRSLGDFSRQHMITSLRPGGRSSRSSG
jgi:hypothetical protein